MLRRRHDTPRLRPVTAAIAALLTVGAAHAQPDTEGAAPLSESLPVEVTVASTFCGGVDDVEREVTRRSPRVHFVRSVGSEQRQVSVAVPAAPQPGRVGAKVVLRTGREQQSRELWAKSCDDLVRAVGFIISVTYDPPSPELATSNGGESAGAEADRRPSGENQPTATSAPPEPSGTSAYRESYLDFEVDVPIDRSPGEPGRWRGGLGASAVWGLAPSATLGGLGFVALSFGAADAVGAMARVTVSADFSSAEAFDGGEAIFRRWSGQLLLGPEWDLGVVDLGLGVSGRAGALRAEGRSTTEPRSYDRLWFDVGGSIVARLELSSRWSLETELSVSKPLTRYAFQFDPVVFHRVSSWLGHVGLAASVAF